MFSIRYLITSKVTQHNYYVPATIVFPGVYFSSRICSPSS